jgi:coenzyme F420-reducing hydrogenase beta subunit
MHLGNPFMLAGGFQQAGKRMDSIQKVVGNGVCIGCGSCASIAGSSINLRLNDYGYFSVDLSEANAHELAAASKVCPFADEAENETVLGEKLYSGRAGNHDPRIGYYDALYAGRVNTDDENIKSFSSGGLTSWVNASLLASGAIDGVIHVSEKPGQQGQFFEYAVSESLEQLYSRTKSRYHAVCFSDVVDKIRGNGKKYAFVGVPCFVKAMRLLCQNDAELNRQIVYAFALVCGHMKSAAFAELLAWQTQIAPKNLSKIDFRVKDPTQSSSHYAVTSQDLDGKSKTASSNALYGSNWGHAFFQLQACDYCDDVMGELADASFGDAWLPQYQANWRGTNIVVCRDAKIRQLLLDGLQSDQLVLDVLDKEDIVKSQAGNYRHRWDGLSVRLQDARNKGQWVPTKRIKPGEREVTFLRKAIVRLRQKLASTSHIAFLEAKARNDLGYFTGVMKPLTQRMSRLNALIRWTSREFVLNKLLNPAFYLRKLGLGR